MKFPERSRHGDEAHVAAVERLDDAREHERELIGAAEAAANTPGEAQAQDARDSAHDAVAVREAWVHWIERGV